MTPGRTDPGTGIRLIKMGKVIDLEEERQKARARAKEYPPFMCLRSKDGKTRIMPKWEKGPDGEWRIRHLDAIKAMLGYGRDETDKDEDSQED